MIQGYHALSLPRSHYWSAGHSSPAGFGLCGVFLFVLLVCFLFVWFCFVVRFLLCDGIVTALDCIGPPPVYFCGPSEVDGHFASIN